MTSATPGSTRATLTEMDADDPLRRFRDLFVLPSDVIYLDGNSLGALPKAAAARVQSVVETEWARSLISSWNDHGWIELPLTLGSRISSLIGAKPSEVAVGDSVSVNLFKTISAALSMRPGRSVLVTDYENFPTDTYIAQGAARLLGPARLTLRYSAAADVASALDPDVAAVVFSHVDYRTARIEDMLGVTASTHASGALAIWDLSHSVGAMPVDLNGAGADFAVGCGYKYLNGGPGAPALLFAAERHHGTMRQPLSGWLGHASPFQFSGDYEPADGIRRMLTGTPPVLSMAALDEAVKMFAEVSLAELRAKSMAMTSLLVELVESLCAGHGLELASPRAAAQRGSHVIFRHEQGYAVVQALTRRGVVGDFRAPDFIRLGVAPLYTRYVDLWDAVVHLREVLKRGEWDMPDLKVRRAVT